MARQLFADMVSYRLLRHLFAFGLSFAFMFWLGVSSSSDGGCSRPNGELIIASPRSRASRTQTVRGHDRSSVRFPPKLAVRSLASVFDPNLPRGSVGHCGLNITLDCP